MRRLAIFWLACAAVGFLAAVGAALALSYALDGAAWRAAQPRVVEQEDDAVSNAAVQSNAATPSKATDKPQSMLATLLGPG